METYYPADAVYWIWLQRKLGIPSRILSAVISLEGGAKLIYESTPDKLWQLGLFSVKTINILNDRDLEMDRRTLNNCISAGISVTCPGDENYPRQLLNLPDPPAVLYYIGRIRENAARLCIALVGTRNATLYGQSAAEELSRRLAQAGATIVSGCAKGIDTAAHNGALQSDGKHTIAVLGCGIDCRYNMANEKLRERIARSGALVSEYPPGSEAKPHHFPIRNRIISGLSRGTVVVEADVGSGSLITAGLATEQGRDVFAMPTGVGTANSSGIHRLLEEGVHPVRSPLDILGEYAAMYPGTISLRGAERPLMFGEEPQLVEQAKPEDLPPTKREKAMDTVFQPDTGELPDFVSHGARHIHQFLRSTPQLSDNLARQADITAEEAVILLSELEMCGYAQSHSGGRYSLL